MLIDEERFIEYAESTDETEYVIGHMIFCCSLYGVGGHWSQRKLR